MSAGDYALAVAKFLGWLALGAWIVFSILVAFGSPLYTAGGVDVGVWLVWFHWAVAIAAIPALVVSVRVHNTKPMLSLGIAWLTPVVFCGLWIASYRFYNAVLCEACVELPW